MRRIYIISFFLYCFPLILNSQGMLRGKVTDNNGEALIGATVTVRSATLSGTVTDLDGNYSIKIPNSGPHLIEVRFVGYNSVNDTVRVQPGEVQIKDFEVEMASNIINEVTVVARVSKARDSYMEKMKIKSGAVLDYISTETIKKTGDSNVSSAVSRITGVSTYSGFITVRGISDRYIKTSINGLRIPTLDPFTNNIRLDLFPSSLVDNIIVTKTESSDLPGDWAGAYISIETVDFPEKFALSCESGFGYNSGATFKYIISSRKSKTDWLGYDSGLRNIRHIQTSYNELFNLEYKEFCALGLKDFFNNLGIDENTVFIDTYKRLALAELGFLGKALVNDPVAAADAEARYNASSMKQEALFSASSLEVKMAQSLPNIWVPIERKAPIDFSQSFSVGNQTNLFHRPLGYLLGIRYYMTTQYDDETMYGRSDYDGNMTVDMSNPFDLYKVYGFGKMSVETNGWSAILNCSYKINNNNNLSLVFMPNVLGSNKVRNDFNAKLETGSPITWYSTGQFYESRSQMVYQYKSNHYIPSVKTKVEIDASYTDGKSNAPDYRQFNYVLDTHTGDIKNMFIKRYSNNRVFQLLTEELFDSHISAELALGENPGLVRKLKFGGAFQKLVRESDQRSYLLPQAIAEQRIYNNDIEGFFRPDSFALNNGVIKRYYYQEAGPANKTIGFKGSFAGFAMIDYSVSNALRLSGGLRIEYVHLHTDRYDCYEKQYAYNDDRRINFNDPLFRRFLPGLMNRTFILPSFNVVYRLNRDEQLPVNIRANFSQMNAPPSLRELTPFRVFDFSLNGIVTGNDKLKPVYINNYDLRAEAYFKKGNNLSVSLFYKDFKNHIELIRQDLDETYYSWQNAGKSFVRGLEVEGRIGILDGLDLRANTTIVESKTLLVSDSVSHPMFGQAPYIVNAMLSYSSQKLGLDATISYNIQGPKLVIAGSAGRADVYELERNLIDIKLSKKLGKHFGLSLKIRDLLGNPVIRSYKFRNGWIDFDRYRFGSTYQFSLSYNIN